MRVNINPGLLRKALVYNCSLIVNSCIAWWGKGPTDCELLPYSHVTLVNFSQFLVFYLQNGYLLHRIVKIKLDNACKTVSTMPGTLLKTTTIIT